MSLASEHYPSPDTNRLQRRFFEQILLALFAVYLLVDSFNGFATTVLGLPSIVSALYKQGMLLLLLLYAFRFERNTCAWCLVFISFLLIWALLRFFLIDGTGAFGSIQESVKLLYFFIVTMVVASFRCLKTKHLGAMLKFIMLVIILNVVSTYLGFGNKTYGVYGAKGFFYAGNALSGILVICASYFLAKTYKKSLFQFLTISAAFSLLSLIIGTKSGFLGVVLATVFIIIINLDVKGILFGVLTTTALGIIGFFVADAISSSPFYERIIYFYRTGGLYYAIFSGREIFVANLWPYMLNADIMEWLFGLHSQTLVIAHQARVELDWFDMQLYFGTPLTLLAFLGYAVVLTRLLQVEKDNMVNACLVSFILLSFISIVAGHITFNGMVTPLWGVFCGAALNSWRPINDKTPNDYLSNVTSVNENREEHELQHQEPINTDGTRERKGSSPAIKEKAVLLAFGDGGHREQIRRLLEKLRAEEQGIRFVCIHEPMRHTLSEAVENIEVRELRTKAGGRVQNLFNIFRCSYDSFQALRQLRKTWDIRVAISTGPGLAIPVLLSCRMVGIKTIFFESWSRFYHPSLSGKVCRYFVHQLYFQNQSMQKYYPKGQWSGRL